MLNKKIKNYGIVLILIIFIQIIVSILVFKNYETKNHEFINEFDMVIKKNMKSVVTIADGIDFKKDEIVGDMVIGSGVVYSKDGFIITNYHVIKSMGAINVVLNDDSIFIAKVIAFDEEADLALIKIEKDNLVPAEFGNSKLLKLGEQVLAIGTASNLSLRNSVSKGIISGIDRVGYSEFKLIQSDLASNTGFSGGPLINSDGKVIGLNSFKSMVSGSEGLTFSIKIEDVKHAIKNFEEFNRIKRAYTGIEISETASQKFGLNQTQGLLIVNVKKDSPAYNVGLRGNDFIEKINDCPVKNKYDFFESLKNIDDSNGTKFSIKRNNKIYEFVLNPMYN